MAGAGEFDLIARCFAPLASDPAALGLRDDAAVLAPTPGRETVLTTDTLVAEVHFRAGDPAQLIARKALRVNLSDLAAMGARPRGYLLNVAWPHDLDDAWIAAFAQGLKADQELFDISLLGGDTVSTRGPLTITVTALGEVEAGRALRRSGARAGERVFVSGTLGDAALGLAVLQGRLEGLDPRDRAALSARYHLPLPRIGLGRVLAERGLASAALDVSDGLLADLGHICEQSGCGAVVQVASLPLSPAAEACLARDAETLQKVVSGGDDYELLFTASESAAEAVRALAEELSLPITEIGRIEAGEDVQLLDRAGQPMTLGRRGWQHR